MMTLKAGWLDRQFERVNAEIREWPTWMRREAGFTEPNTPKTDQPAKVEAQPASQQTPKE
jgi:hypothetical protein